MVVLSPCGNDSILHLLISCTYTFCLYFISIPDEGIDYRTLIESQDVDALTNAMSTATLFNVCNTNISVEDTRNITKALSGNNTISVIHLVHNDIDDESAKELCAALVNNDTITSIRLISTRIGDAIINGIAAALSKNTSVTTLDLTSNKIGTYGNLVLVDVLVQIKL